MKNLYVAVICLIMGASVEAQAVYESSETNVGLTANATVNKPAATALFDLMVVALSYEKGSSEVITPPVGWTLIHRQDNTTNVGIATYYKIAGAAEPASYSFVLANGSKWSIGISRFSNVNNLSTIDVSAGTTGFGNAVTAPSINTTGSNRLVLNLYTNKYRSTYTPDASTTERYDAPNTASGMPSLMMATVTQMSSGATGNKTATATEIEYWSAVQLAVSPSTGVLPVKFIAFDVSKNNNDYKASWSTAEETNSAYYEVERSEDGLNWKAVARIQAVGNATSERSYSYTDRNVTLKKVQYRIKQADQDGKIAYTGIKTFTNHHLAPLYITNSFGQLTVRFTEEIKGNISITMASLNGQVVVDKSFNRAYGSITLPVSRLLKGQYILWVRYENSKFVQQVIL